jgi:hypothetical protein
MQQSSMASVEMYAENPEKVGAKEEGGNYIVQLIPSHEALMNIAKKLGPATASKICRTVAAYSPW